MSWVETLTTENSSLKDENRALKEHLLKLRVHQHCKNLLFDGYDEQRHEKDKECYSKVKRILSYLYKDDPEKDVSQHWIK